MISKSSRRGSILTDNLSKLKDYKLKYETLSILGKGSFGKVRLCRDKENSSMKYAIKTLKKQNLSKSGIKGLSDEISILRDLDHPNIVKYFETYEDDQFIHIVMEYIPGEDLFKVIQNKKFRKSKPFTEKDACSIIFYILKALKFIHSSQIVHRDLKPSNILFSIDGELVIKVVMTL